MPFELSDIQRQGRWTLEEMAQGEKEWAQLGQEADRLCDTVVFVLEGVDRAVSCGHVCLSHPSYICPSAASELSVEKEGRASYP